MQSQVDWRHLVAAVLAVGLVVFGAWKLLGPREELPNAPAQAGPNARTGDAPEFAPAGGPGTSVPTAQ